MERPDLKQICNDINSKHARSVFGSLLGFEPSHKKIVRLFDESRNSSDVFYDQTARGNACVKNYNEGYKLQAVDAYMRAHGLDGGEGWKQAVIELGKEFGYLVDDYDKKIYQKRTYTPKIQPTEKEKANCNRLSNPKFFADYLPMHLDYFARFGIGADTLRKYGVLPLKSFDLVNLETEVARTIEIDELAFAYEVSKDCYKKYQPTSDKFKWQWIGERPVGVMVWGLEHLPAMCEKVLIVEGLKDAMSANALLNQHQIWAVGLDTASSTITKDILDKIGEHTKKIILCLDNDDTGKKWNKKYSEQHSLACLPYTRTEKDFSDMVASGDFDAKDAVDWIYTNTVEPEPKEQVKTLKNTIKFWYISDKGSLVIDSRKFIMFCESKGIRAYKTRNSAGDIVDDMYVIVKDRVVEPIRVKEIKLMIQRIISEEFPEEIDSKKISKRDGSENEVVMKVEDLLKKLIDGEKTYFAKFDWLSELQDDFNVDTQNRCFMYFQNCVLEICRENGKVLRRILDYKDITGYVWKKHIIRRDFKLVDNYTESDYFKFLKNISGGGKKMKSLMQIGGYLIHTHKNEGFQKSVILSDEGLELGSRGGRGKGLFFKGIGYVRNVVYIKGEGLNMESNHLFQRVSPETNLVLFDDVERHFNFRKLFTEITEGLTVNRKNKDEFFLDYGKAPKIAITTNFVIAGESDSYERRKIEFEVKAHYNKNFTPANEFNRTFFSGWDNEEWIRFFNVMAQCVAQYFDSYQGGVPNIEVENANTGRRKLIHYCEKHEMFPEWADKNLACGIRYNKKVIYEDYLQLDDDANDRNKLTQRRFTDYVMYYAKNYHNWDVSSEQSNGGYFITFHAPKEI